MTITAQMRKIQRMATKAIRAGENCEAWIIVINGSDVQMFLPLSSAMRIENKGMSIRAGLI